VIAHQVGGRVDQPCEVQDNHIAQSTSHKKGVPKVFTPKVRGHLRRHDVAHVQSEPRIELLLKSHHWIFFQVGKVHGSSSCHDVRVLLDKEPPHVSEKESTCRVVRIRIGFGILVVHAVIASPMVNATLIGDAVAEHEKDTDGKCSFVTAVGPQAMHSDGDAKTTAMRV